MRYIDADALIKKLFPYDVVDKKDYTINAKAVSDAIAKTPTADVVPKSEVDELSGKYEDLKLKYAELQKDKDELIAWGNDKKTEVKLDFTEEEIMRSLREAGIEVSDKSISEIKAEVARAIFEEIDIIFSEHYGKASEKTDLKLLEPLRQAQRFVINEIYDDLAELKKKYTENENG